MFEKRKADKQGSLGAQKNTESQNAPVSQPKATMTTSGEKAVIGAGIKISGDITGNENLVIRGKVEGKINLGSNEVEIENSAQVNADVTAKVVKISGNVHGDIIGNEKVIISQSGNVRGNIIAPRVTLEDGAKFKGSIDMDPSDNAAAEIPLSSKHTTEKVKAVADNTQREPSLGLKSR